MLEEAKNLNKCIHENLIQIVGICVKDFRLNAIVMEYMNGGDLLNYLRYYKLGCYKIAFLIVISYTVYLNIYFKEFTFQSKKKLGKFFSY